MTQKHRTRTTGTLIVLCKGIQFGDVAVCENQPEQPKTV